MGIFQSKYKIVLNTPEIDDRKFSILRYDSLLFSKTENDDQVISIPKSPTDELKKLIRFIQMINL